MMNIIKPVFQQLIPHCLPIQSTPSTLFLNLANTFFYESIQILLKLKLAKPFTPADIPIIDLTEPCAKTQIVSACKQFGFFKVINHSVPRELIDTLEDKALRFFSLSQTEKDGISPPYGTRTIGKNGDEGLLEHLVLPNSRSRPLSSQVPNTNLSCVDEYQSQVERLGCEVLELIADGLLISERDIYSKLVNHQNNDSVLRVNHYPASDPEEIQAGTEILGFGAHTDPQIISILRSNSAMGLQITRDGKTWVPVPSDPNSFFVLVGDMLQVLTNNRFHSVKHRVLVGSPIERLSVVCFIAPPEETIMAPTRAIMKRNEVNKYKQFSWGEYMKFTRANTLDANRLPHFKKWWCPTWY